MNEIIGNVQPLAVVNPPMRKVIDLSSSTRERADEVAKELGSWLGEQGFKVEAHGRVVDSNGPPTEIQNRINSWFGHGEHEAIFSEEKVLTDYPETFDKQYNPPRGMPDPHRANDVKDIRLWSDEIQKELDELKANQDDFTTSDLQGVVEVLARKQLNLSLPAVPRAEIWELSDKMLEYIYETNNPAFRLPKAKSAVEQSMFGEVAVKLSQVDPAKLMPMTSGNPNNEKEVAVCCETKPDAECSCKEENPPTDKEKLIKEIQKLQRELNSQRLSTYIEGDTSEQEMARRKERASKKARFDELVKILWAKNPAEFTDNRVKCDICGEMIDNIDEIPWHYQEKHPEVPQQGKRVVRVGDAKCQHQWRKTKLPPKTLVCDKCGRIEANPPKDEKSDSEYDPEYYWADWGNPRENRHYTAEERDRIMRTPEFQSWLRKWQSEKKKKPKQGYFHAFMSDVGHKAFDLGERKWPSTVRYSDKDKVEIPKKRKHYIQVGQKKRTIQGVKRMKTINPPEDEEQRMVFEDNPKSKSWKMERRTKYRKSTGADTTTRPGAHQMERFWVKGHERGGGFFEEPIHVEGHYRSNPYECPNCEVELVPMGWVCPECGYTRGERNPHDKSWLMERRKKFRYPTGADSTHPPEAHSRDKFWVRGYTRDGTPVSGHYREANPDDEKESIGSLALDNPQPEVPTEQIHTHTFKYLGLCNPVKGGETMKLYKCVDCGKTFTEKK